jgi:multiple sugar transport system permease protein
LISIPLVGVAILMFLPFIWSISFSFGLPQEFFRLPPPVFPSGLRLDNYQTVFERVPFLTFYKNSLVVALVVTLGQMLTCSMGGYAFARLRFPGKRLLFLLFLSAMMVSPQVTFIPNFIIVRSLGMYNTLWALIVPALTNVFGIFLMRQFFETIPQDLEDAAKIDGASFYRIYWHVMLPLAWPSLATLGILTFNTSWNSFLPPLIFINSTSEMTLPLGMIFLRGTGLNTENVGALMAATVLILLPVLVFFMIFQRKIVQGITTTGLKGI